MMKSVLLAVGLCLLVIAMGVACIWELTRWNLEKQEKVEPLSWDAVRLVYAYAFGFTAIVIILLIAIAVVLASTSLACRAGSHPYALTTQITVIICVALVSFVTTIRLFCTSTLHTIPVGSKVLIICPTNVLTSAP